MLITSIKIIKVENKTTRMVGVCSITLDNMFMIHDIKIIQRTDGLLLAMPYKKINSDTFKDIAHPISAEPRKKLEELIFELYEITSKSQNHTQDFKYINAECTSLLEQVASDFEAVEPKTYNDIINENIKQKIESWTE